MSGKPKGKELEPEIEKDDESPSEKPDFQVDLGDPLWNNTINQAKKFLDSVGKDSDSIGKKQTAAMLGEVSIKNEDKKGSEKKIESKESDSTKKDESKSIQLLPCGRRFQKPIDNDSHRNWDGSKNSTGLEEAASKTYVIKKAAVAATRAGLISMGLPLDDLAKLDNGETKRSAKPEAPNSDKKAAKNDSSSSPVISERMLAEIEARGKFQINRATNYISETTHSMLDSALSFVGLGEKKIAEAEKPAAVAAPKARYRQELNWADQKEMIEARDFAFVDRMKEPGEKEAWLERHKELKEDYDRFERLTKAGYFGQIDQMTQAQKRLWKASASDEQLKAYDTYKNAINNGDFSVFDKIGNLPDELNKRSSDPKIEAEKQKTRDEIAADFRVVYDSLTPEQVQGFEQFNDTRKAIAAAKKTGDYSELAKVPPGKTLDLWLKTASQEERDAYGKVSVKRQLADEASSKDWFDHASAEQKKAFFDALRKMSSQEIDSWWSKSPSSNPSKDDPWSLAQKDYMADKISRDQGANDGPLDKSASSLSKIPPLEPLTDKEKISLGDYSSARQQFSKLLTEEKDNLLKATLADPKLSQSERSALEALKKVDPEAARLAAFLSKIDAPGKDPNDRYESYRRFQVNENSGYLAHVDRMDSKQLRQWLENASPEQRQSYEVYMDSKNAGDYSFVNRDNFEQFKKLASPQDIKAYTEFRERLNAGDFTFLDKLNGENKLNIGNPARFSDADFARYNDYLLRRQAGDYSFISKQSPEAQKNWYENATAEQQKEFDAFKEKVQAGIYSFIDDYLAKKNAGLGTAEIEKAKADWLQENSQMTLDGKAINVAENFKHYSDEVKAMKQNLESFRKLDVMTSTERQAFLDAHPDLRNTYKDWQVKRAVGDYSFIDRLSAADKASLLAQYASSDNPRVRAAAEGYKAYQERIKAGDYSHIYLMDHESYEHWLREAGPQEKAKYQTFVDRINAGDLSFLDRYSQATRNDWFNRMNSLDASKTQGDGLDEFRKNISSYKDDLSKGYELFKSRTAAGDWSMMDRLSNRNWTDFQVNSSKEQWKAYTEYKLQIEKKDYSFVDRMRDQKSNGSSAQLDAWLLTAGTAEKQAYLNYRNGIEGTAKLSVGDKAEDLDNQIRASFKSPVEVKGVISAATEQKPDARKPAEELKVADTGNKNNQDVYEDFYKKLSKARSPEEKAVVIQNLNTEDKKAIAGYLASADESSQEAFSREVSRNGYQRDLTKANFLRELAEYNPRIKELQQEAIDRARGGLGPGKWTAVKEEAPAESNNNKAVTKAPAGVVSTIPETDKGNNGTKTEETKKAATELPQVQKPAEQALVQRTGYTENPFNNSSTGTAPAGAPVKTEVEAPKGLSSRAKEAAQLDVPLSNWQKANANPAAPVTPLPVPGLPAPSAPGSDPHPLPGRVAEPPPPEVSLTDKAKGPRVIESVPVAGEPQTKLPQVTKPTGTDNGNPPLQTPAPVGGSPSQTPISNSVGTVPGLPGADTKPGSENKPSAEAKPTTDPIKANPDPSRSSPDPTRPAVDTNKVNTDPKPSAENTHLPLPSRQESERQFAQSQAYQDYLKRLQDDNKKDSVQNSQTQIGNNNQPSNPAQSSNSTQAGNSVENKSTPAQLPTTTGGDSKALDNKTPANSELSRNTAPAENKSSEAKTAENKSTNNPEQKSSSNTDSRTPQVSGDSKASSQTQDPGKMPADMSGAASRARDNSGADPSQIAGSKLSDLLKPGTDAKGNSQDASSSGGKGEASAPATKGDIKSEIQALSKGDLASKTDGTIAKQDTGTALKAEAGKADSSAAGNKGEAVGRGEFAGKDGPTGKADISGQKPDSVKPDASSAKAEQAGIKSELQTGIRSDKSTAESQVSGKGELQGARPQEMTPAAKADAKASESAKAGEGSSGKTAGTAEAGTAGRVVGDLSAKPGEAGREGKSAIPDKGTQTGGSETASSSKGEKNTSGGVSSGAVVFTGKPEGSAKPEKAGEIISDPAGGKPGSKDPGIGLSQMGSSSPGAAGQKAQPDPQSGNQAGTSGAATVQAINLPQVQIVGQTANDPKGGDPKNSGAVPDPKAAPPDPKTASGDPKSLPTDPKSPSTDPKSADPKAVLSDPKAQPADPKSATTDPKSTATDPKSAATDPKSAATDPKSAATDPKSAATDPKSAATDPKSAATDPKSA
ncbi:MAG: hypothetical protein K2X27_20260, partial [Candidatus Obscuribacterales bacterium]|nr:hypothetical protein [Candidatus Obscuribacterales bacterium]